MGFRDPFQYRARADIDKGYPDLHNGSKWSLKKIQKVKTNSLKLIASINFTPLDLRLDAIWLAQFYFQRYFTQNSFRDNTPVVFATACIHMACKASDLPRPLDKVIKETYRLRFTREEVERKKIDDLMVFVEFKEKVLMAERALLYCLAFDFRIGDPYSYALKYNSAYKLNSIDQALPWLNRAGQVTTLCLQYPPSTLAVVALWYAQHVEVGEIPVDENGLEWWEKLPIEKQDRFPLPRPTPESIEDIHWQLIVELDQKALEAAVKDSGKLPGEHCGCKACKIHKRKLEEAGDAQAAAPIAAQADAPAQTPAPAPASADPANASQDVPAADFPMDNAVRSQAQSSGLLEAARDTGASAPRTGTGDVPAATTATAQPPAATANASAGSVTATAGTASGAPAHIDQASSAYPVRPLLARHVTSRPRSGSPAAAVVVSDERINGAAASPSDRPGLFEDHLDVSERSARRPLLQKGGPSSMYPAAPQTTGHSFHQQHEAEPAHEHQNGHQSATADNDVDSLEDGEIEDGEVLPDGTIAGAAVDMHANGALAHTNGDSYGAEQTNGHGTSVSPCLASATGNGKGRHVVNKRKRSPEHDGSERVNGYDTSKARALPQGTPA
ncbi:TPA: hypothetical protein ACH3X1_001927 [Trebouxia sp. C0004]